MFATNIVTAVDVMKTIEKPLSLGVHMSNNLDEILSLTKEITYQDGDDFDITVTEYGEELSKTKDIEFLWIARNTSSTVKKQVQILSLLMIKILQKMSKKTDL